MHGSTFLSGNRGSVRPTSGVADVGVMSGTMRICFGWNFTCATITWHEPTPQIVRDNTFRIALTARRRRLAVVGSCRRIQKAVTPQCQHSIGETS